LEAVAAAFPQLEIIECIGQGGMGVVFKARQPKLDRFVALKLLPEKPGTDPAFEERFNREARVLARLSHPNIVAVHDFGQSGPFFYLLMEYVDGVNLRQAMRVERFTPAQALALVPKICDALQYAHEEGVLHRDIKPENLLLDQRGRVKIADFGIAKLLGDAKDITLTASGATIGTPHYMAPEQLERPHDVDQRADVYSLGVVFYEMLTGELPIGRFAPPSEKAPMDPRVDQVVLRTLEKERERRFQSAGDVKTQVERITANPGSAPGQTSTASLAAGEPPLPPGAQSSPTSTSVSDSCRWSVSAIAAVALVGSSLLEFALVMLQSEPVGSNEVTFLFLFMGLPALGGTLLAWRALRAFRANPGQLRGARLALVSAVAWPLLLVNLLILMVPLVFVKNLQWQVFHARGGFLIGLVVALSVLGILGLDAFLLRRLLARWRSERALPTAELQAHLSRFPRWILWPAGVALAILSFVFLVNFRQLNRIEEPVRVDVVIDPSAPPGYEVTPGSVPGSDNHLYRSTVTVPPGYALTAAAVLLSNQIVVQPASSNTAASLLAPNGAPVHGQLIWRLLGNRSFADGAPLQFSLSLQGGPDRADKSFHIMPPEPVIVDWAAEPPQIWPPQNGHTKFLLMKGEPANLGLGPEPGTVWAVGIELRLDPIPEDVLRTLKDPLVRVGTNSLAVVENTGAIPAETTDSASPTAAEPPPTVDPEKLAEYQAVCRLLNGLANEEQELLVQFTPESPVVKSLRQRIASNQRIKKQLEEGNPGLALTKPGHLQSQVPEK
jgi:serine/threonine protein kinase